MSSSRRSRRHGNRFAKPRSFHQRPRFAPEKLEPRMLLAVNVTNYQYSISTLGANTNEVTLTPQNVNSTTFGLKGTLTVDGTVTAQPLYVSGVNITIGSHQGVHNVVFVATEHDSLYAFDADNYTLLWQTSFLSGNTAGVSYVNPAVSSGTVATFSSSEVGSTDISPEIGIVGTPTIDVVGNTLYVTPKTKLTSGSNTYAFIQLYAINLSNGLLQTSRGGGVTTIAETQYNASSSNGYPSSYGFNYMVGPSVPGVGYKNVVFDYNNATSYTNEAVNNQVYFNALKQMDRPAITLDPNGPNGSSQIIVAFGSHGDNQPYHGWVLAYNSSTLALSGVFNSEPDGEAGGIWQGGGGVAVDSSGNLFFETGNGTFGDPAYEVGATNLTPPLDANGFPTVPNYGDCVVKLQFDSTTTSSNPGTNGWGLKLVDYFTPWNQKGINNNDTDLGSSGLLILPATMGTNAHPELIVARGKSGVVYLLDAANLGKYNTTTDQVVEETTPSNGYWSSPTYWNGNLYGTASSGPLYQLTVTPGQFSTSIIHSSTDTYSFPGATSSVSANGTVNGIIWAVNRTTNTLEAYDATNVSTLLYSTSQAAGGRDTLGTVIKMTVPIIANGEVFASGGSAVKVYGLLSTPTSIPPTPTGLAATGQTPSYIKLTWTRGATTSANLETDFEIWRSTDNNTFAQVGLASAGATSYLDTTAIPGETYYYTVRAVNANGHSVSTSSMSAAAPLGDSGVWADSDIGGPTPTGSATFANNTLTVAGAGADIWGTSDQFHYIYQPITGDQTIVAKVSGQTNTNAWAKAGVMIRDSLNANAAYAFASMSPSNGSTFQYRLSDGGSANWNNTSILTGATTVWVKLVRTGNTITASASTDGVSYTQMDSQTFTNLPQTVYFGMAVTSHNNGTLGSANFSNVAIGTGNQLPAAPTSLNYQIATGSQLNLTWTDNATTEDGFKVMRGLGASPASYSLVATVPAAVSTGSTVNFFDTGLTNGATYSYKILASNTTGDSTASNTITVTIPTPPGSLTNMTTSNLTATGVTLSWQLADNTDNGVNVYRRDTTTSLYSLIASLPAHSTTYTDNALTPNTDHDYDVQAFNIGGYSGPASAAIVTLTTPPTSPSASESSNHVQLTWTAPAAGADSYDIYRSTTPGGEGTTPYVTGITSNSYQDTNLTSGNTYYYTMSAVNAGGQSAASGEANAQFVAPTATITQVTTPTTSPVSQISISFNEAVSGFARGSLSLTRNGGSNLLTASQTLTDSGDHQHFTLTNLSALTTPLGNYTLTFTATGSGVTDSSSNTAVSNASMSFTETGPAPQISAIYVDGAAWQSSFLSYLASNSLGSATLGYAIPSGSAQLKDLPWLNITNVSVQFTEDVTINTAQAGFALTGSSSGPSIPALNTATFSYNSTTHVATWAFAAALPMDKFLLTIPSAAVTNGLGAQLDGEFTNGSSSYPTGNGSAGGDFKFRFNILPGDIDQTGMVDLNDASAVRNHFLLFPNQAGYSAYMDTYGKGRITGLDLWTVQDYFNLTLSSYSEPTSPLVALAAGQLSDGSSSGSLAPTLGTVSTFVLTSAPVAGLGDAMPTFSSGGGLPMTVVSSPSLNVAPPAGGSSMPASTTDDSTTTTVSSDSTLTTAPVATTTTEPTSVASTSTSTADTGSTASKPFSHEPITVSATLIDTPTSSSVFHAGAAGRPLMIRAGDVDALMDEFGSGRGLVKNLLRRH